MQRVLSTTVTRVRLQRDARRRRTKRRTPATDTTRTRVASLSVRHTRFRTHDMFAMSASASYATTKAIATPRRASRASRATSVIRAADAAKDAAPAAPAVWTAPKLNPNTPSPIFGGSTGGLLRKAHVRHWIRDRDTRA